MNIHIQEGVICSSNMQGECIRILTLKNVPNEDDDFGTHECMLYNLLIGEQEPSDATSSGIINIFDESPIVVIDCFPRDFLPGSFPDRIHFDIFLHTSTKCVARKIGDEYIVVNARKNTSSHQKGDIFPKFVVLDPSSE